MIISIPLHSILYIVGPTKSGRDILINKLKEHIRKYEIEVECLLDSNPLSQELLFNNINKLSSYPTNSKIIIVNSYIPYEELSSKLTFTAKKNGYNLIPIALDFKTDQEVLIKKGLKKQLRIYQHNTLSHINKRNYKSFIKLNTKQFNNVQFGVENTHLLNQTQISNENEYVIIGDIHGCFDSLMALLKKCDFNIQNNKIENTKKRIILVGDLIDKGPNSKEVLQFVIENKKYIHVVKGNHEEWVYKKLNNKKQDQISLDIQKKYFTDSIKYKGDEEYKILLNKVYEFAKPFVENKYFIVTHAPCSNKYLGKVNSKSINNQKNQRLPQKSEFNTTKDYLEMVKYVYRHLWEEANVAHKKHIFGHWAMEEVFSFKNKLGIDTGAVRGNKLTALHFIKNEFKEISVPTVEKVKKEKVYNFNEGDMNV